jgi:hypothetical protein
LILALGPEFVREATLPVNGRNARVHFSASSGEGDAYMGHETERSFHRFSVQ